MWATSRKSPTEKRKYDIISPILFGACCNEDMMVENQVTVLHQKVEAKYWRQWNILIEGRPRSLHIYLPCPSLDFISCKRKVKLCLKLLLSQVFCHLQPNLTLAGKKNNNVVIYIDEISKAWWNCQEPEAWFPGQGWPSEWLICPSLFAPWSEWLSHCTHEPLRLSHLSSDIWERLEQSIVWKQLLLWPPILAVGSQSKNNTEQDRKTERWE